MKNLFKRVLNICSENENFEEKITEVILFHKVISVKQFGNQEAELELDNGAILRTKGNEGCGGCENGWFYLNDLNTCDNVITKVECKIDGDPRFDEGTYHIYVYAEDKKINLVQYDGNNNGFYGMGYEVEVYVKKD